jgi:hypothetical protein
MQPWYVGLQLRSLYKTPFDASTMKSAAFFCLFLLASLLSGCAVVAVADAAVTVVATGVKVTAKAVGAVADAVIPDGK